MFAFKRRNKNEELYEETGNYYYGARYYDPKWSIWLSVDPMAEKYPSHSPYGFVGGNPLNHKEVDGNWWFRKNTQSPYEGRSRYSYRMSNVRSVNSKQTSWKSYIPFIGNVLNFSAMAQKLEDPSMHIESNDIASLVLGGYFKSTRKVIKALGGLKGGAKLALDISETSTKLMAQMALSPELKESWAELGTMRYFNERESENGNVIGYIRNDNDKSYNTSFEFSQDFISELNDKYGSEYDNLGRNERKGSRSEYIDRQVGSHLNDMFENKKAEIMSKVNE